MSENSKTRKYLGQAAYEARFAGYSPRDFDPWSETSSAVRALWDSVATAVITEHEKPVPGWRQLGQEDPHGTRYDVPRSKLAGGQLTDDQVAFRLGMIGRHDLDFEASLAIGKDRIRWLSRQLCNALEVVSAYKPSIEASARRELADAATIRGHVAEIERLRQELADRDTKLNARARPRHLPEGWAPPAAIEAYRGAYDSAFTPGTDSPNAKAHTAGLRAAILADRAAIEPLEEHSRWEEALRICPQLLERLRGDQAEVRRLMHVVWQFSDDCSRANADLLRKIADDVDCGTDRCPHAGSDCGALSCRKIDDGECGFVNAEELRELAKGLEIRRQLTEAEAVQRAREIGAQVLSDATSGGLNKVTEAMLSGQCDHYIPVRAALKAIEGMLAGGFAQPAPAQTAEAADGA